MRGLILVLAVTLGTACNVIGLSCTEIGCVSTLTIHVVDPDPADRDFDVVAVVGDDTLLCSGRFDAAGGLACSEMGVFPTGDGYDIEIQIVEEGPVDLSITRDATVGFEGPVEVAWDEPSFPNGKACGPRCISGSATVTIE